MAKVLRKFEFKPQAARTGFQSKYDWDVILGGQPVQLDKGEGKDYTIDSGKFKNIVRKAAMKRDMTVKVQLVDTGMVVQAFPANDEDKAKWADAKVARQTRGAARRAAKRAAKRATNGTVGTVGANGDQPAAEPAVPAGTPAPAVA